TARIRGNEREQNLNNNTSSLTIQVQGPALEQAQPTGTGAHVGTLGDRGTPLIAARLSSAGVMEVLVTGPLGASYTIESSTDLVSWEMWASFTSTSPTTTLTERSGKSIRFFRAVRAFER